LHHNKSRGYAEELQHRDRKMKLGLRTELPLMRRWLNQMPARELKVNSTKRLKPRLMKMNNFFFSKNTPRLHLSFLVAVVGSILTVFMKLKCKASLNSFVESFLTRILPLIRIIGTISLSSTEKAQMHTSQQQFAEKIWQVMCAVLFASMPFWSTGALSISTSSPI
jgi:hypothetical protein